MRNRKAAARPAPSGGDRDRDAPASAGVPRRRACLAALGLPLVRPVAAQSSRQGLRIVVPFAPGGTSDLLGRLLAPELGRSLGLAAAVENRPGAGGTIGAAAVARSQPDGRTLLLTEAGALAAARSLSARPTLDALRDLAPVTMLLHAPYVLAAFAGIAPRGAAELAAHARARPRDLVVAHAGIGTPNHLASLLLAGHWGADLTQVPYPGGAAALAAVVAGEAHLVVIGATTAQPFIADGMLRGMAVTGPARLPALPDLPTFAELRWPAEDSGTWQGVLVPRATPRARVDELDDALRGLLARPALQRRLAELGGEVRAEGPEAFRAWLEAEAERWAAVIRAHGIRLD